jgi:hypothetical protein
MAQVLHKFPVAVNVGMKMAKLPKQRALSLGIVEVETRAVAQPPRGEQQSIRRFARKQGCGSGRFYVSMGFTHFLENKLPKHSNFHRLWLCLWSSLISATVCSFPEYSGLYSVIYVHRFHILRLLIPNFTTPNTNE